MAKLAQAHPQISLRLYKTISRKTVDGQSAVSARYQGKEEFIDLAPFLNDASSVRTSKSVREPSGAFSITFADRPHDSVQGAAASASLSALETVYGLVEPMDMIEIRMWGGVGSKPDKLPIKMRGFVSDVQRVQVMGQDGRPQRQVTISGQDYGKIWQMFQVIHLAAYAEGKALLTNFALWDLYGLKAVNTMPAADFVKSMVEKIVNPFISELMPENSQLPKKLTAGDAVSVKHGVVNNSYQSMQGSIYDILKFHGDVGIWNELYVEDTEDAVNVVYRPVPALKLAKKEGDEDAKSRKIQDDAPDPVVVDIPDSQIRSLTSARSDSSVANFFWVRNARYDLIDDQQRQLQSIPAGDSRVSLKDYPNAAIKYYGTRPMYAETQQGDDGVKNAGSGQDAATQTKRSKLMEAWIDKRRRLVIEMNQDNVVLERGSASIKGGLSIKAGNYAKFQTGNLEFLGYVVQVDDEFLPFQSYTTTLAYERGEGFVTRARMEGGAQSPWFAEMATRGGLK